MGNQAIQSERAADAEIERLRALLEEAAEWVCQHSEALSDWEKAGKPSMRVWCSDCHNYLRGEEQRTFPARLLAAVAAWRKP